jgi:hypothetical protein
MSGALGPPPLSSIVRPLAEPMSNKLISVADLAKEKGESPKFVFKILDRLRIERQLLRGTNSRGQRIAFISEEDAKRVSEYLISRDNPDSDGETSETRTPIGTQGWFYLLQLEPGFDPGRFKVGFAMDVSERIRAARCFTPFVKEIAKWPCKPLWEKTAIAFVTDHCEKLATEVFRSGALQSVREKCDRFFAMQPRVDVAVPERSPAEPWAAPNGGPAASPGNSGASEGPPSVS